MTATSRSVADETVTIPLNVAVLVSRAFLPLNPNKLRNATPEVKAAAHAFKDAVSRADHRVALRDAAIATFKSHERCHECNGAGFVLRAAS